jgi:hypothetical protein
LYFHQYLTLITGPINTTDTDGVNGLLAKARYTRDAKEMKNITLLLEANHVFLLTLFTAKGVFWLVFENY